MRIAAPAKLNLCLHITGKRADGYHLLESLVAFTQFGDTLEITQADALTLEIIGPYARALEGENLILRAAKLLQQHTGTSHGARIVLQKNIPVGAGLGGGSSDAASALKALSTLWKTDCDLQALALQLGSDVPVCLTQKPAWIRGIGEQIEPFPLRGDYHVVLTNPGVALPTALVYRAFSGSYAASVMQESSELLPLIAPLRNDLQPPATALLPVIDKLIASLQNTEGCALARMSGSGATCFGLYESEAKAQAACEKIIAANPQWWCVATRLEAA